MKLKEESVRILPHSCSDIKLVAGLMQEHDQDDALNDNQPLFSFQDLGSWLTVKYCKYKENPTVMCQCT